MRAPPWACSVCGSVVGRVSLGVCGGAPRSSGCGRVYFGEVERIRYFGYGCPPSASRGFARRKGRPTGAECALTGFPGGARVAELVAFSRVL